MNAFADLLHNYKIVTMLILNHRFARFFFFFFFFFFDSSNMIVGISRVHPMENLQNKVQLLNPSRPIAQPRSVYPVKHNLDLCISEEHGIAG